jgi:ABC-type multidrug transport system fused ATPase/permease subunit
MAEEKKRRTKLPDAWREARGLIVVHRLRLALGSVLMLINRLVGLALPAASKYIIDEVVIKGRGELLVPIALAAGAATLLQAITSFSLSQILGIAAQRAITEMRIRVQAHVERLPISYFDSTQTGKLVSRIMTDAEGVKNLVGTGLVQYCDCGDLYRSPLLSQLAIDNSHNHRPACLWREHSIRLY